MGMHVVCESAFLRTVAHADSIELAASQLGMGRGGHSRLLDALEQAAQRGAKVTVRLAADPYDPAGTGVRGRANRAVIAVLREHGVDAATVAFPQDAPLHMKAAVVDGCAFLDDRNWPSDGRDTIVALDGRGAVARVRAAMRGDADDASSDGALALRKVSALAREAAAIRSAPRGAVVEVASESFGPGALASALLARAQAGGKVRVLVEERALRSNRGEGLLLERLVAAGAEVRTAGRDGDEKLCVAGDRGWVGSANATAGLPDTVDWGVTTRERAVVDRLRTAFEREWRSARALAAPEGLFGVVRCNTMNYASRR